ncbi:MAG: hypothetical protein LBL90_13070 [Prevotellaceae bacterium]|jgi:hypothetical protein|nr:hypothetical protein [Prevotellaceae bacterium]
MSNIHFAAIRRGNKFSPNHTGNDSAIFELTMHRLYNKGCTVDIYTESEFCEKDIQEKFIYGMARDKCCVSKLQQCEDNGAFVINSGYGIEKCFRANMTISLLNSNVPYPRSFLVNTGEDATEAFNSLGGKIFWIKRGDFHAIHKEDVTPVHSIEEGNMILKEFAVRNIKEAVISEHLIGDLVKFYGVRGTDFFYWFYPFDIQHSKFGHEAINGEAKHFPFDQHRLKEISTKAATVLDVYIYGGDAIIGANGNIDIIDLNDWPSFAPCRDEAFVYITEIIYKLAEEHSVRLANEINNSKKNGYYTKSII